MLHIIKGCPRDKWDEVQAIQHQPFIYVHHNGSHWAGDEESDIAALLDMLANHTLDPEWEKYSNFISQNPCAADDNPDWNYSSPDSVPRWIDGEPLYAVPVTRYFGNFYDWSHVFCIDTNHVETIAALNAAIAANKASVAYQQAKQQRKAA